MIEDGDGGGLNDEDGQVNQQKQKFRVPSNIRVLLLTNSSLNGFANFLYF